jgi:hypothetical protein
MMRSRTGPGQVEITFRYCRHVGPGYVHDALTLQFDALKPYAFVSQARWPSGENYEATIREAIETVLEELQGHLDTTRVVLKAIELDDVNSCAIGFRRAAAAATRAAFDV